jgi:hypothetical protein
MADVKIVDGVPVPLSAQEEADTIALWAAQKLENDNDAKTNGYKYSRLQEYPPIIDMITMIWDAMDKGSLPNNNTFYTTLKAIHDKHPAPAPSPVPPA